jgi:prepilin-type N-terminal cleavage/methylation domain-containing protein
MTNFAAFFLQPMLNAAIWDNYLGESFMGTQHKNESQIEKITGHQGFTLIEILVAMAVFAIGFLAVGSMQISAIENNASARTRSEATVLAADKFEDLMSVGYSDPDLSAGGLHEDPNAIYRLEWLVTDNYPSFATKTIALVVCWRENSPAPADCNPAAGLKTVDIDFIRADL